MGRPAALRLAVPALFLIIVGILVLTTTRYSTYIKSNILRIDLDEEQPTLVAEEPAIETPGPSETPEIIGAHYHVKPSAATKAKGFKGCEYPIVIHVTPDGHCTGALALYGSIVRNVLLQPTALQKKVCVHMTYVNTNLTRIEDMYKWPAEPNPFKNVTDCAALDTTPALNGVVPVRFQGLLPMETPKKIHTVRPSWIAAMNKVHSWGFDLYPRILILDADSMLLSDLHKIFLESPIDSTITGAPDQYRDCHDRARINGGMILLKPSRYFHMISAELLHDPRGSCISQDHDWSQSEQELINCMCGYRYTKFLPMRPEFRCDIMPVYNSVWPKSYGCSDVNLLPMRSIHFADARKPWQVEEERLDERVDTKFYKCVRDGARNGSLQALKACKGVNSEASRKLPNLWY
jgi:hypothetical protein